MKTFMFYTLLIFVGLTSCKKEKSEDKTTDNALQGRWTMTEINENFGGKENPNSGDVVWNFTSNTELNVQINNMPNKSPFIEQSGNYTYSYDAQNHLLNIQMGGNSVSLGVFLNGASLKLDYNSSSDGPFYKFERY